MGNVVSGIGGGLGGVGGMKSILGGIGQMTAIDGSQVNSLIQQLLGNLTSTLSQAEQLAAGGAAVAPGAGQSLVRSFQVDLTRLAYIAALQKAVKKASGSGAFNLETAINDLWVALDCVKRGQQTTSLKAQSQNAAMGDTVQMMSSIMKQMHDSTASVINNMR